MAVQASKLDYEGITSFALSLVPVSSANGNLDGASVLDALLAWTWDTSVVQIRRFVIAGLVVYTGVCHVYAFNDMDRHVECPAVIFLEDYILT